MGLAGIKATVFKQWGPAAGNYWKLGMSGNYTIAMALLLIGIFGGQSCSKEGQGPHPTEESIPLIRTKVKDDTTFLSFISYYYDSLNRLSASLFCDTALMETFTYNQNTVEKTSFWQNAVSSVEIYTLDSNGLAVSMVSIDHLDKTPGSSGNPDTTWYAYEYDPEGYMTYKYSQSAFGSTSWEFYNAEGNLYFERISNGYETDQYGFGYYTDKENTIGNWNSGIRFLGKPNKNPLKSVSLNYYGTIQNFSYEYDGKNRITKVIDDFGHFEAYTYW